ncbi:MAG: class II aldolase/adducin family protein [Capsulimonas sp.]|uniref:class II aldolase/adducin family protein n=1 Tax=Capsulimonas sp. TaxID=2494211 RepID=UPI003263D431
MANSSTAASPLASSEDLPSLEELMRLIGEAGTRLVEIEAAEGAAGNISVFLGWDTDLSAHFPREQPYTLPEAVPELAGKIFLVTGSGRRLREIGRDPEANLGALRILPGGESATLYTSERCLFERPTSEFNSHLAVHRAMIARDNLNFHAVIHAQPLYLTYLSHIPRYQDTRYLNRHILRWQPETLVHLPRGVAFLPFLMPGSPELMDATVSSMEADYRVVLWAKHGVMARSDQSVKRAADRIEYAETGARYEYLNLTNHGLADGLTEDELRRIAEKFGVDQDYF